MISFIKKILNKKSKADAERKCVFDAGVQVKLASKLAKNKDFNGAIDALHEVYKNNGASESNLIKILPYYQKAGRYSEMFAFCQNVAVPNIEILNSKAFSHKCEELKECFFNLSMSRLYGKMALCAEREGADGEAEEYIKQEKEYGEEYERLLPIGEEIEWKREKVRMLSTFGKDKQQWPDFIRNTYGHQTYNDYIKSDHNPVQRIQ
ncbi:MAG: hypothetical protein GY774_27985 [Planctomycetes bacterium]|nr:hypothetical protein [Planctomycetota bacterium]